MSAERLSVGVQKPFTSNWTWISHAGGKLSVTDLCASFSSHFSFFLILRQGLIKLPRFTCSPDKPWTCKSSCLSLSSRWDYWLPSPWHTLWALDLPGAVRECGQGRHTDTVSEIWGLVDLGLLKRVFYYRVNRERGRKCILLSTAGKDAGSLRTDEGWATVYGIQLDEGDRFS